MADTESSWIAADWPAPGHIRAGSTTRRGGYSESPYDSFNLAQHVGDTSGAVTRNRQRLQTLLGLPSEPVWLDQVHGRRVIQATKSDARSTDAAWTTTPGIVCTVMTADCLPLLLTDRTGSCVAAVHVGWRGLLAGIIEETIQALPVAPDQLLAWLGPCIGPTAFEVGSDVHKAYLSILPRANAAFRSNRPGHWLADLPALARMALTEAGVRESYTSGHCTYSQPARFYSHRRDGRTGRMASLIWMDAGPA